MIRLFFLIRSLDMGGAERQLIELVRGLDKNCFEVTVATFYDGGVLRPEIERIDQVKVFSLRKQGRWDILPFLWRLWRAVREAKPHILHGYMGGANEFCLLTGKVPGAKVVWGLRASNVDFMHYDWLAEWNFRVGAWLSRFPDLIIVNSWAGKQHHIAHGYCGDRMLVIPNGIDTERYRPDREAGRHVRAEWGVAENELLVGLVGRLDPMKDHATFLRAAARVAEERPDVRFVCVGDGPEPYRRELLALGESLGLRERLIWAGARSDMPAVYNAFDIVVSSSYGEGFPNTVGEAMACGVPCVVTGVGDSARIVGETGIVVPARNPEALATGMIRLLTSPERCGRGDAASLRIREMFSRERLLESTQAALFSIAK